MGEMDETESDRKTCTDRLNRMKGRVRLVSTPTHIHTETFISSHGYSLKIHSPNTPTAESGPPHELSLPPRPPRSIPPLSFLRNLRLPPTILHLQLCLNLPCVHLNISAPGSITQIKGEYEKSERREFRKALRDILE